MSARLVERFALASVIWPVSIDAWQYLSAGPRFSVGDSVNWGLMLEDGSDQAAPGQRLVTASWAIIHRQVMTPTRDWPAPAYERLTVQSGGVRAVYRAPAYHAPPRTSGTCAFTGLLYEDHHGASDRPTQGVVRAIEIVTRRFGSDNNEPERRIVTGWETRRVEQSPQRLDHQAEPIGPEFTVGGRSGWRSARTIAQEDVLVAVEYPDR